MLAESSDGTRLAAGHFRNRTVEVLNLPGGDLLWKQSYWEFDSHQSPTFSPDGRFLAGSGENGRIRLWEAETGAELHADREHLGWVTATAISEDGRYLGSAEMDGTVLVRDLATGKLVRRWNLPNALSAIAIRSGLGLVCVGENQRPYTLKLLSLRTGEVIAQSPTLNDRVGFLNFSGDGKSIVTRNRMERIVIFDPLTLSVRRTIDERENLIGGKLCITSDARSAIALSEGASGAQTARSADRRSHLHEPPESLANH